MSKSKPKKDKPLTTNQLIALFREVLEAPVSKLCASEAEERASTLETQLREFSQTPARWR